MTIEEMNNAEEEGVKELRRRLSGEMDQHLYEDTNMFQRFLRARNHNINAAEVMLRNHIQWRKVNKIDTILQDHVPNEIFEKYVTLDILGLDKEGFPVWYWEIGACDLKGVVKSLRRSEISRNIIHALEKSVRTMNEQTAKRGKTVDKCTHVLNFEHLALSTATHKLTLDTIRILVQMYEANYPERLKAGIVINASAIFSIGFAVIKPFLSGPTAKKIKIYGRDGWKDELLQHMDASIIPAYLGGTLTDPDGNPLCKACIHHGINVPESLYLQKTKKALCEKPDVQKIFVSRMSKTELPLYISDPGSCIEWEFETKNGDIGFAILYKGNKSDTAEPELVVPKQRIDTDAATETGLFRCEKPGLYVMEFDNTYSWWHQKEVYCKTTIKESHVNE